MCTLERNEKVVAIIQARTGSTRLPSKVLHMIKGKTVLEHVVSRVKQCKMIDEVVVATTVEKQDLDIVALCAKMGVSVYCGSEQDVLDRYYQAARLFGADCVVRITADCPMHDWKIIDLVIEKHFENKSDYTSNTIEETFPDGVDTEVVNFGVLEQAWMEADLRSDREHVTPFIRRMDKFTKYSVKNEINYRDERWTLDEPEDEAFIKEVFDKLYDEDPWFGMDKILELENRYPELRKINKGIVRNEGYFMSLQNDKICSDN